MTSTCTLKRKINFVILYYGVSGTYFSPEVVMNYEHEGKREKAKEENEVQMQKIILYYTNLY